MRNDDYYDDDATRDVDFDDDQYQGDSISLSFEDYEPYEDLEMQVSPDQYEPDEFSEADSEQIRIDRRLAEEKLADEIERQEKSYRFWWILVAVCVILLLIGFWGFYNLFTPDEDDPRFNLTGKTPSKDDGSDGGNVEDDDIWGAGMGSLLLDRVGDAPITDDKSVTFGCCTSVDQLTPEQKAALTCTICGLACGCCLPGGACATCGEIFGQLCGCGPKREGDNCVERFCPSCLPCCAKLGCCGIKAGKVDLEAECCCPGEFCNKCGRGQCCECCPGSCCDCGYLCGCCRELGKCCVGLAANWWWQVGGAIIFTASTPGLWYLYESEMQNNPMQGPGELNTWILVGVVTCFTFAVCCWVLVAQTFFRKCIEWGARLNFDKTTEPQAKVFVDANPAT